MSIQENIFSQYSALKSLDVTDKAVVEKLYEQLLAMDLTTDKAVKEFLQKRDLLEKHLTNEEFESYFLMTKGDEFQHWIYANPGHSVDERRQNWLDLTAIYSPGYDRSGYEESTGKSGWQFIHILQLPFYLIDYAISEILALTLWDRYKSDPADAIHHYKKGCSLAASRPVPEIYETFGSQFSFGEEVIEPLAKRIATDLKLEMSGSLET